MKQYTRREFVKVLNANGFEYKRSKGSHDIYYNDEGRHISVPATLIDVIARRLIKENNLKLKDACTKSKSNRQNIHCNQT